MSGSGESEAAFSRKSNSNKFSPISARGRLKPNKKISANSNTGSNAGFTKHYSEKTLRGTKYKGAPLLQNHHAFAFAKHILRCNIESRMFMFKSCQLPTIASKKT